MAAAIAVAAAATVATGCTVAMEASGSRRMLLALRDAPPASLRCCLDKRCGD